MKWTVAPDAMPLAGEKTEPVFFWLVGARYLEEWWWMWREWSWLSSYNIRESSLSISLI
jgi:hypothetical protein